MLGAFVASATLLAALGSPHLLGDLGTAPSAVTGPHDRGVATPTVQEIAKEHPKKVDEAARFPAKKKAEEPAQKEDKGAGRVIVPVVFYSPETHFGVGGLLVQFFRFGDSPATSRVSSVAFDVLVTTRKQALFEIIPDLYWDNERNHLDGKLEFQRYPDSFWGIGSRTPDSNEERYDRQRLRLRAGFQRQLFARIYAGLLSDFTLFSPTYSKPGGIFETTEVPGKDGGFTGGLGPIWSYDTRDNAVSARSGTLMSAAWLGYDHALGSRYEFYRLITEVRQFFPVGKESAIGFRYFGEFRGGNVPYYYMQTLGGDEILRGYFFGRFRDKDAIAVESEYRFPLFWRFGAVTFAGLGEVAERLSKLASVPLRWTVGGGLRLALSTEERLNLRLDVGVGEGTYGAYFTAREAF